MSQTSVQMYVIDVGTNRIARTINNTYNAMYEVTDILTVRKLKESRRREQYDRDFHVHGHVEVFFIRLERSDMWLCAITY